MLIKRELNRNFRSFAIVTGIASVMAGYIISLAPSFGADIQQLLDVKLPKNMQTAFGMDNLNFSSALGVYSISFSYLYLFFAVFAAGIFSTIVSKEFTDKTAEFLFVLPESRSRIMLKKLLVALLYLFLSVAVVFIVSWIMLQTVESGDLNAGPVLLCAVAWLLGSLSMGALAFLLSSFSKRGKTAYTMGIGLVLILFLLQIIISLNQADWLKLVSPFDWFKANEIMAGNSISLFYCLWAIGISAVCLLVGFWRFKRADVVL